MENFRIIFEKGSVYEEEDYWIFNGIHDDYLDYDKFVNRSFNYINELKNVILKDFERILEYRILQCNNSEKLSFEIERLLNTYSNYLVDKEGENFIILTDDYLCFNNLEEEAELDFYFKNTFKTTVIVSRNFRIFYFIREKINILTGKVKTSIKRFEVQNDHIQVKKNTIKKKLSLFTHPLFDFPDQDIQKTIDIVNFQYLRKK